MTPALSPRSKPTKGLFALFGGFYFIQGIAEPMEGLIAQPVRSLLRAAGHDAGDITVFGLLLSLPWCIKPLFGLITDFVPFWGSRRRSWLMLWTAITTVTLVGLWAFEVTGRMAALSLLLVPALGIAFTDVIVDALMIEEGQPRGLTGALQSAQWAASWFATIVTGALGGWLAESGRQRWGFAICAAGAALALMLAVAVVREPSTARPETSLRGASRALTRSLAEPGVLSVALFLILLNFNPYGHAVRYVHMTEVLGISEAFYGRMVSVEAASAVIAALVYGRMARARSSAWLVNASVLGTIGSTLCWWLLRGERTALLAAVLSGFLLMWTSLTQLEVAARLCPPGVAATVFASLMAVSNLSIAGAEALGGAFYTAGSQSLGRQVAFDALVAVGAAFTALTWCVLPRLARAEPAAAARVASAE